MIVPDDKDWTWVTDRRCPECSFDGAATAASEVAGLVRSNVQAWRSLLADGAIRSGRPNPERWSSLEYACHVRDVYRRYRERIELMLSEDDPLFANWDQDASATDERYDAQDAATVVGDLASTGEGLANRLDGVSGEAWQRRGRRSDGAGFTVDTIARYMVHDTIHHIWDLTGSSVV